MAIAGKSSFIIGDTSSNFANVMLVFACVQAHFLLNYGYFGFGGVEYLLGENFKGVFSPPSHGLPYLLRALQDFWPSHGGHTPGWLQGEE